MLVSKARLIEFLPRREKRNEFPSGYYEGLTTHM